MTRHFALISLVAVLCCTWLAAVWGDGPPAADQIVVLRNGEVLRGQVVRQEDHYRITLANGELRLRAAEVELICHDLDEAYRAKRAQIQMDRADDHLDLAEWCLRQSLPGDAARELSAALVLEPKNPRIAFVDRRLQQALAPPPAPTAANDHPPPRVTDEDLDRLVRSLPPGTLETFNASVQPMLMSSCATAGCHGSGGTASFSLLRVPSDRFASRRLTQRNLQSTLMWLDPTNPPQSRLLIAASKAHGGAAAAILDPQGIKFRQLAAWIILATQRGSGMTESAGRPATVHPATVGGARGTDEVPADTAADADSRPVRPSDKPKTTGAHHVRPNKPTTTRPDAAGEAASGGNAPSHPTPVPAPPPAAAPPSTGDPYDPAGFNNQAKEPKPAEKKE